MEEEGDHCQPRRSRSRSPEPRRERSRSPQPRRESAPKSRRDLSPVTRLDRRPQPPTHNGLNFELILDIEKFHRKSREDRYKNPIQFVYGGVILPMDDDEIERQFERSMAERRRGQDADGNNLPVRYHHRPRFAGYGSIKEHVPFYYFQTERDE